MRSRLVPAIALALFANSPAAAAAPDQPIFRTSAMIVTGEIDKDGSAWFKTWDDDARFVLDKGDAAGAEELFQLLSKSRENARSVDVRFDASAVRLNPATATLDFPICSVSMEETSFVSARKCGAAKVDTRKIASSPLLAVAFGWAEVRGGSKQAAREFLDQAVRSKQLPSALESIALRARAESNDEIGYDEEVATNRADQAFAAALADYARLAELHPENVEFRFSQAFDLEQLGDFAGAERMYDAILKQWPDEKYRVTVRKAAVARITGQLDRSLELLNGLAAELGPDLGMKFYYHRGWTLTRLGRFDEAIADFTEGFKSQSDYPWAYMRRGCAYASVGQLNYAIGDFETATGMMEKLPQAGDSTQVQHDLKVAKEAVATFKRAQAAAGDQRLSGVCEGFWRAEETARKPSPLLPPARDQVERPKG